MDVQYKYSSTSLYNCATICSHICPIVPLLNYTITICIVPWYYAKPVPLLYISLHQYNTVSTSVVQLSVPSMYHSLYKYTFCTNIVKFFVPLYHFSPLHCTTFCTRCIVYTLQFRIAVYARLFISTRFALLHALIRVSTAINFQTFFWDFEKNTPSRDG